MGDTPQTSGLRWTHPPETGQALFEIDIYCGRQYLMIPKSVKKFPLTWRQADESWFYWRW